MVFDGKAVETVPVNQVHWTSVPGILNQWTVYLLISLQILKFDWVCWTHWETLLKGLSDLLIGCRNPCPNGLWQFLHIYFINIYHDYKVPEKAQNGGSNSCLGNAKIKKLSWGSPHSLLTYWWGNWYSTENPMFQGVQKPFNLIWKPNNDFC